jgi:transcriptional regulator with XRE-family HTH domain
MHTRGVAIPYADVLAKNVRAARARSGLEQEALATRMRALGFSAWRRQTVAAVEKSTRRLTAEETLGLALALETRLTSLLEPVRDDGPIELPSGQVMLFLTVHELIWGGSELTVWWNGNEPEFPAKDPLMSATGYVVPPPKSRRTESGGKT